MKNVRNKIISMGLSLLMLTGFTVLSNGFVKSYGCGGGYEELENQPQDEFTMLLNEIIRDGEGQDNERKEMQEREIERRRIQVEIAKIKSQEAELRKKIGDEETEIRRYERYIGGVEERVREHKQNKIGYQQKLKEKQEEKKQLENQLKG